VCTITPISLKSVLKNAFKYMRKDAYEENINV